MRTSVAGLAAIQQREGVRLRAYRDSKGILTIGVGHTGRAAPPRLTAGMVITRARVTEILQADIGPMEITVTALLKRPISQGCFDAVMSLVFNIGGEAFRKSTVLRRINAGDLPGAADAILLWNKPASLIGRRRAERRQFLRGIAATAAVAPTPVLARPQRPPAAQAVQLPPLPVQPVTPPPPIATGHQETVMRNKTPFLLGLLLAVFGVSAANAGEIDFAPLVGAGIEYLIVPLLGVLATWVVGEIGLAVRRVAAKYPAYVDQQTAALFAQNVDAVLSKGISFGAAQATSYIGTRDLHANVDGWVASYAAKYAVEHAPDLMKQAGDITQKIAARLADHPAVQELHAKVSAAAPVTAAAA